jgi:hypothetical protein
MQITTSLGNSDPRTWYPSLPNGELKTLPTLAEDAH